MPGAAARVLQRKVDAPSRSASIQTGAPPGYRPQSGQGLQQMPAVQAAAGQRSAVVAPAVAAPPVNKLGGLKEGMQRKLQAPAPPAYRPANMGATQRAVDGKGLPAVTVPTPPPAILVAGNAVLQMQRDGAFLRAMGRQLDRQQRGEARRQEQQFRRQQGPRRPRWGNAGAQGQREQARREQEAREVEQALQERARRYEEARQAEEARLEATRREQIRLEQIRQEEARREQIRMEEARRADEARLAEKARQDALADFKKKKNHSDRVGYWTTPNCVILFPEEGQREKVRDASRKTGFDSALSSLTIEGMGKFLRWCGYLAERPTEQSLKSAATSSGDSGVMNPVRGTVSGLRKKNDFDGGVGARWHVHYGEHVKFGTRDGTRRNFKGRTQTDILDALTAIVKAEPGLNMGDNAPSYAAVREWIMTHRGAFAER
jgi:hypothetical protein